MDMPAVAVTDTNNMFCALEFAVAAKGRGCSRSTAARSRSTARTRAAGGSERPPAAVVLLAQSETGYRNLMKLNSWLYLRGDGRRRMSRSTISRPMPTGLICLTGGPDGPLGRYLRDGQRAKAEALAARLAAIYPGRLYVELQRHRARTAAAVERGLRRDRLCPGPAARRDERRPFR